MRATMKIATNTAVDNILDNYSRLLNIQNQMARGRSVLAPSDDPLAVNEAVRIQTVLAQIEQHDRNLQIGESFLGLSDSALQSVNDILSSSRALTVNMASDNMTPDARQAATIEINSYLQELVEIGNRKFGERYIFGGTRTMQQTFELVGGKYVLFNGNEDDIQLQVDSSSYATVNTKASDVFGSLITTTQSDSLAPKINMGLNTSTRLEDLNDGDGVADGSVKIRVEVAAGTYTEYDIDLTAADTIEDVKDVIETATGGDVTVESNNASTGINVINSVFPGNLITVSEIGNNTVARDLGILGTNAGGTITGGDLNPVLSRQTLLSDIPGYYGNPLFISNGTENLISPEVAEVDDPGSLLSGYNLTGLIQGKNASVDDKLYFDVNGTSVKVYKNSKMAAEDLVADGTAAAVPGTVTLVARNGSGLTGSVNVDFPGPGRTEVDVTFPEAFQGNVNEEIFVEQGDLLNQVDSWQLHGLMKGTDTGPLGELTYSVSTVGPNAQIDIINPVTGQIVAQGTSAGTSGMVTLNGVVDGNGVDHTHLNGSVYLDYQGVAIANQNLTPTFKTVDEFMNAVDNSDTYTTARISDDGKMLEIKSRLAGATLHVIETDPAFEELNGSNDLRAWNLTGIEAGVNSDVNGNVYATYTSAVPGPGPYTVNLYSDSSYTQLVATGTTAAAFPATLTINEANNSGLSGTVLLTGYAGDDNDIVLRDLSVGLSGKFREDNVFSTMNMVVESGEQDDVDELHNLLGNFDDDIERVLNGRGEIGAKLQRFEMLSNRLADETTNFSTILSDRIDLDYADAVVKFQQESNIFNAALSVAGKVIPMSLVDYI